MSRVGYIKYSVGDAHYVYDTTTNGIVRISDAASHILEDYLRVGAAEVVRLHKRRFKLEVLEAAVAFLETARTKRGMFQPFFRKNFAALFDRERVEQAISRHLGALGLNLTDACNQRCTYCVYSGLYSGERVHGTDAMTWEVARRCIDYYFAHASEDKPATITFYGGEPLLNWEVLRRCVSYVRCDRGEEHADLRIATNLTALTDTMLAFLVANDVGLQVSIDGPPEIHDHARLFPNGRGTHATVMARLARLREEDPRYYRDSVSLACTMDRSNDPSGIVNYFIQDELLRDLPVTFGALRESDIDGITVPPRVRELHDRRLDRLLQEYVGEMQQPHGEAYHRTIHNLFWSVFGQHAERRPGLASEIAAPNSACVPGAAHLFAASNGKFYTCEKLSIPGYEIGDSERGIDVDAVHSLLGTYVDYCNELCQDCWAYRLCTQCFLHAIEGGRIGKEQKRRNCVHTRREIRRALERFTFVWENEPDSSYDQPFSLHHAVRQARRSQ